MKRNARLDFKGVSSIAPEKSRQLLASLDSIVTQMLAAYEGVDDPRMPRLEKSKKLASLGVPERDFAIVEEMVNENLSVVPSQFIDVRAEAESHRNGLVRAISNAKDAYRRISSDPSDNGAVVTMFESQLEIIRETIEVLKSVDNSTIERIKRLSQAVEAALRSADRAHDFESLADAIAKSNFSALNGQFTVQLSNRSQAYKDETRERIASAAEFLKNGLPAFMSSKKEEIERPHDASARAARESLYRTLSDKLDEAKELSTRPPIFEVNWIIEYEVDPIGRALQQLADAVLSGDRAKAGNAAREFADEMNQALDAAGALKPTMNDSDSRLVDQITGEARRIMPEPVKAAIEAVNNINTPRFPELLDTLNEKNSETVNLMARMPSVRHMETITESTSLIGAASDLIKNLKSLFA
jgi:hypothetical protein